MPVIASPSADDQRAVRSGHRAGPDDAALRVDRRPPRPQRERQQDRRQDEADRERDVRGEQERERVRASRAIVGGGAVRPRRRASSATQSPSARRPSTSRPAASNAARTSASRSMKMPDATRIPPGRSSSCSAGASGTSTPAMRLASTTSNGGSPVGRLPSRARTRRTRRFRRAFASVASMAIGSVSTPRAVAAPSRTAAIARIPRAAPDVEDARAGERPRSASASSAGQAQPRRRVQAGPERHPRVEGEDDVVRPRSVPAPGRPDDDPPTDAQHREVRLPGVGPVRLVDDARPELADRPQPERLEMAERLGHLRDGPSAAAAVARGHVGADDRRPRRVDPRPEPLLDEVERRLHGRAAGRDPAEDLADRLDRLEVGLDRELEPRAAPAPSSGRPPPSPEPELLAKPAAGADLLAGLLGVRVEQLALRASRAWSGRRRRRARAGRPRAGPPEVRHALAAEPDLGVGLGAGLDLDLLVAVDGRDRGSSSRAPPGRSRRRPRRRARCRRA